MLWVGNPARSGSSPHLYRASPFRVERGDNRGIDLINLLTKSLSLSMKDLM
ncbi:hypothetical protein ACNKHT_19625 [Shigella flexneri]